MATPEAGSPSAQDQGKEGKQQAENKKLVGPIRLILYKYDVASGKTTQSSALVLENEFAQKTLAKVRIYLVKKDAMNKIQ
jgi:hypothetical protein